MSFGRCPFRGGSRGFFTLLTHGGAGAPWVSDPHGKARWLAYRGDGARRAQRRHLGRRALSAPLVGVGQPATGSCGKPATGNRQPARNVPALPAVPTSVKVEIRYFDDCPNWESTRDLVVALTGVVPMLRRVATPEEAEALRFVGSPTVLVDGVDPWSDPSQHVGLACRVYRTPEGRLAGAPTEAMLRAVLGR